MDIFLNQLIQFYLNNATNLRISSLNFTHYDMLPHNIEITDNCDVTSPCVYISPHRITQHNIQTQKKCGRARQTLVVLLMDAPWRSRNSIMLIWPKWQAVCNGV